MIWEERGKEKWGALQDGPAETYRPRVAAFSAATWSHL